MKADSSTFNEKCKSFNAILFPGGEVRVKPEVRELGRLKISGTWISVLSIFFSCDSNRF